MRVRERGFLGGSKSSVEYNLPTISHIVLCVSSEFLNESKSMTGLSMLVCASIYFFDIGITLPQVILELPGEEAVVVVLILVVQ